MKKIKAFSWIGVVALCAAGSVHASLIWHAFDDFQQSDYGAVEVSIHNLGGGYGWDSNWSRTSGTTANFHPDRHRVYTATGYVNTGTSGGTGGGGAVNMVGTDTNRLDRDLDGDDLTEGHIWFSLIKDQQSITGNDRRVTLSFGTTAGCMTFGARSGNVGLGSTAGFINLDNTHQSAINTTGISLMVGHIDIDNKTARMWYNPSDVSSIAAMGTADFTYDASGPDPTVDLSSIPSEIRLYLQDTGTRITVDALRIAAGPSSDDAFQAVMIPEPGTSALFAAALATVLAWRRRRR